MAASRAGALAARASGLGRATLYHWLALDRAGGNVYVPRLEEPDRMGVV